MDPAPTERDARLVDLLDQALAELRAGRPLDTATWQELAPDLADDLPGLLETLRDLDGAAETWRCGRTIAPEPTGDGGPAPPPAPPARVGRYEVLEPLGAGGMGQVYRARDPQLNRVVAVKVPHLGGAGSLELRKARFLREARAAAAVRHPHVCPIHDVGEEGGLPYVVMAFLEGQSLAERLRRQPRFDDPREAVALVLQVAGALEAVHAHGIVHRDLKPGNILLDLPGTSAYLSDFGLARPGDAGGQLTVEGDLLGTPAYMAAEQAAGQAEQVGPWTDLYSLGVVLYQMLTGRLPYEGPTTLSVLHKIASEAPPPPSHFRADLDPALEAVIQKALARRPEDRFRAARAFAEALDRWASGLPPLPAETGPSPAASSAQSPAVTPAPAVRLTAEPPPTASPQQQTVVLSGLPEGQSLQLSLPSGAKADVKVMMAGGAAGKRPRKRRPWRVTVSISLSVAALLVAVGVALYLNLPLHSPGSFGGREMAQGGPDEAAKRAEEARRREAEALAKLDKDKKTRIVPGAARGPAAIRLELVEARAGGGEVVSEVLGRVEGDKLVAELPRYLKRGAGEPRVVVMRLPDRTSVAVKGKVREGKFVASWSPELTARAYARPKAQGPKGREKFRYPEADFQEALALLTPDRREGAVQLWQHALTARQEDEAQPVGLDAPTVTMHFLHMHESFVEETPLPEERDCAEAAGVIGLLPPDAGFPSRFAAVALIDRFSGAGPAVPLLRPANRSGPLRWAFLGEHEANSRTLAATQLQAFGARRAVFSPDGKRLAIRGEVNNPGQVRVWEAATGKEVLPLKGHTGAVCSVAFSPDGKRLAVGSGDGVVKVWDLTGRKSLFTVAAHTGRVNAVCFSPDGQRLASGSEDRTARVWHLPSGKEVRQLAGPRAAVTALTFSPDGKRLATAGRDGQAWLWDVATGKALATTPRGPEPIAAVEFTADGAEIVACDVAESVHVWAATAGK
jgi:serine/threonine protein kinase